MKLRDAAVRVFRGGQHVFTAVRDAIRRCTGATRRRFVLTRQRTEHFVMHAQGWLTEHVPLYRKYREYIDYMIFGFLTSVVHFAVYYVLIFLRMHYVLADNVGFFVAVIVSYDTNKRFVYHNETAGMWNRIYQFIMFVGARLVGQLLETILLIIFVEWIGVSDMIAKFPVLVIVILINFLSGKLLVFTKQQAEAEQKPKPKPKQ